MELEATVTDEPVAGDASTVDETVQDAMVDEMLVEEIAIDGMCGVY